MPNEYGITAKEATEALTAAISLKGKILTKSKIGTLNL